MSDCLFCKIIDGTIQGEKDFENENVMGFSDINPQAKQHYIFIHKKHTKNVNDMIDNDPEQLKDIFMAISEFTKKNGLAGSGFRVVTNFGDHGGQTVFHTHLHVLGGEKLKSFGA